MKKFFAIAAAALVAFGFASCKGGNDPESGAFKIDVTNITTKGASIAVTPADTTVTYYWDVIEATEAAKMDDEAVAAYYKDYFDYVIDYYTELGYSVSYADLLLKGNDEYEYTSLDANTEYTIVAIALDANLAAAGKSVRKNFKTLELKEDPVPADMTFQIEVDGITFNTAAVAITPSKDDSYYYWNIFETSEITGMADADLCAAMKENIEYMVDYYSYYGYDVAFEDFLSKGPDAYEFEDLTPNTDYTVVAVAMGTLGTTNGAVAKKTFSTPELVAESEVTLSYHDAQIVDFRDYDGSFEIVASPADSTEVVVLNPFSTDFAGSFTMEDLDPDYSLFIDYEAYEQYAIAAAEFTGVESAENTYTYTGWFLAMNAVKYNFEFTAVVGADEAATAPAHAVKKAQAKKEPKHLKKGNVKKGAKRSEKLLNR